MLSPSRRKAVLLLLILSLLSTSGLWAAGSAARNEQPAKAAAPAPASLLGRAWNLLATLWAKSGCAIDPDGRCVPHPDPASAATPQGDTGCAVDPNGRCRS